MSMGALLLAGSAHAAPRGKLVKDINPGKQSAFYSDEYVGAANIGKTLYFGASDGTHGVELWKSDGNYRRTRLVKDIDRTPDASGLCCGMTELDGRLLFGAHDAGIHGGELGHPTGPRGERGS